MTVANRRYGAWSRRLLLVVGGWLATACLAGAEEVKTAGMLQEFAVKREALFAFARKPTLMRDGDRTTIQFETTAFCDVTVAIEDASEIVAGLPRIVRHLASGVLGPNAPEPFQKNSKSQTLVWDGKNDRGAYVDDRASLAVRVSLGLKPRFERSLLWEPKTRVSPRAALMVARPEGVYVFEGVGVDHIRLFDHEGNYLRMEYVLPGVSDRARWNAWYSGCGIMTRVEIDMYADPPVVWISTELQKGNFGAAAISGWNGGIRLLTADGDQLKLKRDFGADAAKTLPSLTPAVKFSRYLLVNPGNGRLLVADARGCNPRRMPDLIEVDPESGRSRAVNVPFPRVQDLAFDYEGHAYGRVGGFIIRFDFATGREIPWDYGEERGAIQSGLPMGSDNWWNLQNGIGLAPDGSIAALSLRWAPLKKFQGEKPIHADAPWQPKIYPGRPDGHVLTVWDRHGKVLSRDAIPGTPMTSGIGLDARRNLVVMANVARSLPGKAPGFHTTCTLMKVTPGKARFLTSGKAAAPLPAEHRPNRPRDVASGWVEGAHWLYGGVGYTIAGTIHCMCWHSRFAMDGFGRSFAPEPDIYRVAVLDTNGNLMLRVGRYGNVDDGAPLVRNGGPDDPRPLGGDEVALFQPNYVGVHTDNRLFVADAGNGRIVSVKLDYHAEEKVALNDVAVNATTAATDY